MAMPTLQQIIGTITGKVAFERTQANFTIIKDAHNSLETTVGTKAPNADLVAHKAENATDDVHGLAFKGVAITQTDNTSIASSVDTKVVFNQEIYDFGDFFNIINPTRITIPTGVGKVQLFVMTRFLGNATGVRRTQVLKNNSSVWALQPVVQDRGHSDDSSYMMITTPVLPVVAGDYFELSVYQTSGIALLLFGATNRLYFSLKVVE